MNTGITDANTPNLGIRTSRQQSLASYEGSLSHLKVAAVNINSDNLAVVPSFYLRTDLPFVEIRPAPGVLFFAVTRLSDSHLLPPSLSLIHDFCRFKYTINTFSALKPLGRFPLAPSVESANLRLSPSTS